MTNSSTHSNDTDVSVQSIPVWIKVGGTVFVLVIVLIGLFIANNSGSAVVEPENTVTTLENQLQQAKPASDRIENSLESKQISIANSEPAITETKQALAHSQHNLIKIETLESQLAQSQQTADSTGQKFEQLNTTVQDLNNQLNDLQQTVLQLRANPVKKKTAVHKKRRPLAKLKTPFTLVNIDHWGTQLNAVLRYNIQIFTLRQGVNFQGWIIETIDMNNESVTLKNSKGQTVTLKTSG